jgi:hypothetical protein
MWYQKTQKFMLNQKFSIGLKKTEKGISKKRLQKVQNPENTFVGKKFLGSY